MSAGTKRTQTHTHTHTEEGLHQQRSMRIHAAGFIWSWTTAFTLIPETHTHTHSDSKSLTTHLPKQPSLIVHVCLSVLPACVVVCLWLCIYHELPKRWKGELSGALRHWQMVMMKNVSPEIQSGVGSLPEDVHSSHTTRSHGCCRCPLRSEQRYIYVALRICQRICLPHRYESLLGTGPFLEGADNSNLVS